MFDDVLKWREQLQYLEKAPFYDTHILCDLPVESIPGWRGVAINSCMRRHGPSQPSDRLYAVVEQLFPILHAPPPSPGRD